MMMIFGYITKILNSRFRDFFIKKVPIWVSVLTKGQFSRVLLCIPPKGYQLNSKLVPLVLCLQFHRKDTNSKLVPPFLCQRFHQKDTNFTSELVPPSLCRRFHQKDTNFNSQLVPWYSCVDSTKRMSIQFQVPRN